MNNYLAAATVDQGTGGVGGGAGATGSIVNPLLGGLKFTGGPAFFQNFFGNLISLLLVVGSVIFLFMLIIGAIKWISSGGDKGSLESAKGQITNALIGIVILFAVFAVVSLIGYFFGGLNLLQPALTPVTP